MTKKTPPQSCLLSPSIPLLWIPAGVIPSSARNVLLWLWDFYHYSHAMLWQSDLFWGEKCDLAGLGISQKEILRGIWQMSSSVQGLKIKVTWKYTALPPLICHSLLIKTQMSIYLVKKCDGPIWHINQQLRCLAQITHFPLKQKPQWAAGQLGVLQSRLQLHLCAQIRLTGLTSWQGVKASSFTLSEGKTRTTHTSTQHAKANAWADC